MHNTAAGCHYRFSTQHIGCSRAYHHSQPLVTLQSHGIPLVHDLPGVGANLQDHLEIYVQQKCTQPITLYNRSSWKFPHNMIRIGMQWFINQTGEGASSHLESGGFARSNDSVGDFVIDLCMFIVCAAVYAGSTVDLVCNGFWGPTVLSAISENSV